MGWLRLNDLRRFKDLAVPDIFDNISKTLGDFKHEDAFLLILRDYKQRHVLT